MIACLICGCDSHESVCDACKPHHAEARHQLMLDDTSTAAGRAHVIERARMLRLDYMTRPTAWARVLGEVWP